MNINEALKLAGDYADSLTGMIPDDDPKDLDIAWANARADAARLSGAGLFAVSLMALVGVGWTVPARQWDLIVLFVTVALLTAWATGSEWREARECREAARELERGR